MTLTHVGIVGLGLIGGSIAAAARAAGLRVSGLDMDPQHLDIATRRGLLDATCDTLTDLAGAANVVVVATPVGSIADVLTRIDSAGSGNALILDTGSVKVPVVRTMERLNAASRSVGGHPIAGRETAGPENAAADLLRGCIFVLTPNSRTDEATMRNAQHFVRLLGMEPVIMQPARHDAVLARTSHLPQLLSTVLALTAEPEDLPLAGPGFRDMTRLARSDARMWRDILFANEENMTSTVALFVNRLQGVMTAIQRGDDEGLTELIENGRRTAGLVQMGGTE